MRYFLYLTIFFLFNSIQAKSQDSLNNSIGIQLGIARLDFFTGFRYARSFDKLVPFCTAEMGINRTIFQSRFFPKLGIGTSYFLLNKPKLKIGTQLSYGHSVLKVNSASNHFHNWNELYLGGRLEIGSKIRLTIEANSGLLNERYYNQFSKKKEGLNSLGFNGNIGLLYVW
jgi:hypothetical protein